MYMGAVNNIWHVLMCVMKYSVYGCSQQHLVCVDLCNGNTVYMGAVNNIWHVLMCVMESQCIWVQSTTFGMC